MKKDVKTRYLLFLFLFLLSGCGKNFSPAYRAVTAVDISFRYEDMLLQRHYTQSDKIESVLLYLRLLKSLGTTTEHATGDNRDVYDIAVRFSDGTTKHYLQKSHRFLSRRAHVWERIDPGQAANLYALMRHYPSDGIF
jgi:hypothetical protein